MDFEVTIERFDDLSENEKSHWYGDNDCCAFLRVRHHGDTVLLKRDKIEPEDVSFHRDLRWIEDALRMCYGLGREDGINEPTILET